MFKLIAIITSLASGSPEIIDVRHSKFIFADEKLCHDFLESAGGAESKRYLDMVVAQMAEKRQEHLLVENKCVPTQTKPGEVQPDDGKI